MCREMRLLRLTVLLLLATIVVVEPVVHSHPLLPDAGGSGLSSPNICAICAVGAEHAVMSPAVLVAPVIVIDDVAPQRAQAATAEVSVSLASRAPPAA